jgi:polyribonucleotide nucleotidyltransferase
VWQGSARIGERTISLETGRIARQADGAVLLRDGDTVILVATVSAPEARPGIDFFPLTVDYREKFSAAGRYPGGYLKREARLANHEILSCRLIDRTIRPLFPDGYRNETQVLGTVMSYDPRSDADVLAISAAAAALHVSDIPWNGPVAAVRVAQVDGTLVAMPDPAERERATIDLVVSSGPDGLSMVEGMAREASEDQVIEALLFAQECTHPLIELVEQLRAEVGREKRTFETPVLDPDVVRRVRELAQAPLSDAMRIAGKKERRDTLEAVRGMVMEQVVTDHAGAAVVGDDAAETTPDPEARLAAAAQAFDDLHHQVVRQQVAHEGRRIDGRALDEIRPISGESAWLPRVHGSAIFTRGETQALVACTLGTTSDEQEVDRLGGKVRERFLLHYSFPPFSVGEVRPVRGPGRREIGHGNLAHRALSAVLPGHEAFPYTIRIESEIAESNGSSSMATVCGGCLALMDAGVPISRPVAGIAMGLIKEGDATVILSDILGDEDHLGDMDFKVAGTEQGISAVQMDNKVGSLPREVLAAALEQARRGRLHILAEMAKVLAEPRPTAPGHAPRIALEKIRRNRIRDLIGPGGQIIRELQETTGTKIDVDDTGNVRIFAPAGTSLEQALESVKNLTGEPEVGRVYAGTVTGVKDFGCFVRIMGSYEGLIHVSELGSTAAVNDGDAMKVRVVGADTQGRLKIERAG